MVVARRWQMPLAVVLGAYAVLAGLLALVVPLKDGVREWTAPLIAGGWMAWTFPTALFYLPLVLLLALMLAYAYPLRVYLGQRAQIAQMQAEQTEQRRRIEDLAACSYRC